LSRRGRAGQKLDDIGGKNRPLRRNEIRLLLLPEIIRNEDLAAVLAGQNEIGSFALEIGGAEEVRVRDGHDGAARLNGNRRCALARVEGFTPGVNHDLTL